MYYVIVCKSIVYFYYPHALFNFYTVQRVFLFRVDVF